MKKALFILILLAVMLPLFSADSGFNLDGGMGLSMAFFDPDDLEYGNEEGAILSLLSMRFGVNGSLRYEFTDSLSIGTEIGCYYLTFDTDTDSYTFIDIPLRAIVRMGKDDTFIQGFAGYYLPIGHELGGVEAGAKVALGGLYITGSYTLGAVDFFRVELGYSLNDIIR